MKGIFLSKTDLAQAYFPYIDARPARHKLMHLISEDGNLVNQLVQSGYSTTSHLLSPMQVNMIIQRFGNPFE